MENYSLTLASGWNRLSTLLEAAGRSVAAGYGFSVLKVKNTHASATVVVKGSSVTQPVSVSGSTLLAGEGESFKPNDFGSINGSEVWFNASAAATIDVSFSVL